MILEIDPKLRTFLWKGDDFLVYYYFLPIYDKGRDFCSG